MAYEGRDGQQHTDFGILYPTGYLIVAFSSEADARRVQQELVAGGYAPADVVLEGSSEVAEAAAANLDDNPGWIARLGMSDEFLQAHLDAAREGATFLRIHAPGERELDRVMTVIRRVPFKLAHHYQRFCIEEMS